MRRRDIVEKFLLLLCPQFKVLKKSYTGYKFATGSFEAWKKFKDKKMQRSIKIGIGSTVAFVFIIIFGWVAFPKILSNKIKAMVNLKEGNDVREMYLKVPFPLVFKIYLFNVTNYEDVSTKGAMPFVQEVGPFIYDEWKEKVDIEENEADDTMTYSIKNTFIFNQELTESLTGNEIVTIPHPLIAGLVMAVEREKPGALSLINKALNSIYRNPKTPFVTAAVKDLLFDGIYIACNVSDFAGKAVCTQLRTEAKDLVEVEPGIFKFSLFGPKNGTKAQRVKVKRGIQDIHDLGRVIEVEGEKKLSIWAGKECNTYQGTDSTIFPPYLTKEEGLVSYAPDICRSLAAYYIGETKYDGIPVRKYGADFGDMSTVKEEKCFCPTPDTCLKKGVMDMTPCVGAPLLASLPHFYMSDPMYGNSVQGLTPDEKKHEIIILFESMTGSPVFAKKRMQFSLPLHAVAKVNCMKELPETVIPLMWVEEGVELNSTWTGQLKNDLFKVLKIVSIVKYLIMFVSLGGIGGAIYLHFSKRGEAVITPVHADQEKRRKDIISMLAQNGNKNEGHVNHGMSENEIDKY